MMNLDSPHGQTEVASTHVFAPVEIDYAGGKPLAENLGQTETPVHVFAVSAIELSAAADAPALAVRFSLRHGVDPSAVSFDLMAAFADLNRLEVSLGGQGLKPDEGRSDLSGAGGVV